MRILLTPIDRRITLQSKAPVWGLEKLLQMGGTCICGSPAKYITGRHPRYDMDDLMSLGDVERPGARSTPANGCEPG